MEKFFYKEAYEVSEDMPSWQIHERWCKRLGIKESVCREVNRIIDSFNHDNVKKLLKWRWVRESFESRDSIGELNSVIENSTIKEFRRDIYQVTSKLAEITNRFGEEGIKATFNHIALDRIAELIKQGFKKEEIREKLIKDDLMKYIPDYDQVFSDISKEVYPSESKIQRRKEFEESTKSGISGKFYIDGKSLPAPSGLVHIKGKIKRGEKIYVEWGAEAWEAQRGKICKFISNEDDLKKLIAEIKDYKRKITSQA
jgi:hypothetical protein